ncbi:Crp/Fnr family transcriptional regulator [Pseudoroseicyclus sp. H15]
MLQDTLDRGMLGLLDQSIRERLRGLCTETRNVGARQLMSPAGKPLNASLLLLDGLMGRYVSDRQGRRQMVAIQVAYDFVDLHALPLGHLDHDVESLTDVRIAVFDHDVLREALRGDFEMTMALWRLTLIDAAIHRHWGFRLGRLRALAGMANFLAEMDYRMRRAGSSQDTEFSLPLTQPDLSDACGMSPVHANRVLRELREAGICTLRDGRLAITDREGLYRTGEFKSDYLYGI